MIGTASRRQANQVVTAARGTFMPFVNIKVAGPTRAAEQILRLQQGATRLMVEVMRKEHRLVAVLVEQVPVAGWSVGNEPARAAAYLDVKVTAGSNTADEQARFVAEAMALLRDVIGPDLDPVAYVVVHELPGAAWGWDGQTQAHRAEVAKAG